MLRSFREMRKRLGEHRNAQKYLLFALSHIFAVAVGIFIALQLDVESRDSRYSAQLQDRSYPPTSRAFIPASGDAPVLSAGAEEFMTRFSKLRNLSFMRTELEPVRKQPITFIWAEAPLIQALDYYREYEAYVAENFGAHELKNKVGRNALDTDFLLHSIVREQLQVVMDRTLRSAQRPWGTSRAVPPAPDIEHKLDAMTSNFSVVMQIMIELRDALRQLEFTEIGAWFKTTTEGHALELISLVDQLSEYPRPPYDALFKISSEAAMTDYLVEQRQRVAFLAFDYAQPPIMYLQNVQYKPALPGQPDKMAKWHDTMVQLDKYRRKDPSSHLQVLEDLFRNASHVSNAECKYDQTPLPAGHNDVFARALEGLIAKIEAYCGSVKSNDEQVKSTSFQPAE